MPINCSRSGECCNSRASVGLPLATLAAVKCQYSSWERERERERKKALSLYAYLRERAPALWERRRGEREKERTTTSNSSIVSTSWLFCHIIVDLPLHRLSPRKKVKDEKSMGKKWWNKDGEAATACCCKRGVRYVCDYERAQSEMKDLKWNPMLCWCVGFNGLTQEACVFGPY